jgi:AcrR family transcriptional regulator
MSRQNRAGQAEAAASPRYHHGDLRNALLAAAADELRDKGIEGFTLRGVAKRAGVSHAAPAHHFKDTNALLTALAEIAFRRFIDAQREAQATAGAGAREQMIASGLGYLDFARQSPELFHLIFTSKRADFADPGLKEASEAAFQHLVDHVAAVRGVTTAGEPGAMGDPGLMLDVLAAWAIVHGISALLLAGHLKHLQEMDEPSRRKVVAAIIDRALP